MRRKFHFGKKTQPPSLPEKYEKKSQIPLLPEKYEQSHRKGAESLRARKVRVTLPRVRFLEEGEDET